MLQLPWRILFLVAAIGSFAVVVLYSAAGGSLQPWAFNHALRFSIFLGAAIVIAQVPLRVWLAIAYPLYAVVLVALIGVEIVGGISGGSQRWLDLGFIRLQPSEFMKLAIVIALARFYHFLPRGYAARLPGIWPPLVLIGMPFLLVILQPDLGTGLMIVAGGATMMFLGGLPLRWFLIPGAAGVAALPLVYNLLHDYQKRRVMIFLDPEADPLGAGIGERVLVVFGRSARHVIGKGHDIGFQCAVSAIIDKMELEDGRVIGPVRELDAPAKQNK